MERAKLLRRGLHLEYVTLGWNVIGTIVVVAAAIAARSVALAGFGIDSLIRAGDRLLWKRAERPSWRHHAVACESVRHSTAQTKE
jgi:hypothetical protein